MKVAAVPSCALGKVGDGFLADTARLVFLWLLRRSWWADARFAVTFLTGPAAPVDRLVLRDRGSRVLR
jgi:hypothetical protein